MIPGHHPQAWWKPRGVPIPDTQFSFGGEEGDGGDEEEILSLEELEEAMVDGIWQKTSRKENRGFSPRYGG